VPVEEPADLSDDQAATLRKLKRRGEDLWRAYSLKEALRAVFAGDLDEAEVAELLDRFCSRASSSGLKPFITLAKTIRKHRSGILTAYGFHNPKAALALIMLTLGPVDHVLPHERRGVPLN
jgi:transposase